MKTTKLILAFMMLAYFLISTSLLAQTSEGTVIPKGQQQPKDVDKDYFKNRTSILPLFENGKISTSTQITSSQLTRVRKSIDPVELKSTSADFTKEMIEVLTHLKSGDKLYFEYILAKAPDETIRKIAPVWFLVK